MSDEDDVIFAYTRAQALADGVLIDVTETAKEAGIRYPVAVTRAVWGWYVEIPEEVEAQDESGRLWDILWVLRCAMGQAKAGQCHLHFQLYIRNSNRAPELVTLKAECGPDDEGNPCLTVMLPGED